MAFYRGLLRQRSCHQPLYFADDSLYDRLPDLRGNHGRSRVEKRGQTGFGAPCRTFCHGGNRYSDDANQPRLLCDGHGALQECDRNRDFQRAIYDDWNSSRTRALYRDVGFS